MHRSRRPARWMSVACVLMGGALLTACGLAPQEQLRQLGQRWFNGEAPLQARMVGHAQDLPAAAAACINCHGAGASSERFAVALNRNWLTQPQARRGGPLSRYDATSFCRVLREGIDPAWVVVNQTMPRYEVTGLQCRALWMHLIQAGRPDAGR
ncbi:hypothetical protein [Aquabacterium parvum]|uniref:hypothetical protein n=1 Tax=Aquabacterium parvum TaxID=70584 RepID=UPI00128F831F|nr:hypothetical protein [Aquabacterium parvum]